MDPDKQTTDNSNASAVPDAKQRRVIMQVDETGKAPTYANAFQVQTGQMEVVVDFGYRTVAGQLNAPKENEGADPVSRLRFLIAHRVALPYPVAKQLSTMLQQAIEDAESRSAGKK